MAESTRQIQSRSPYDRFDEAVSDGRSYATDSYEQPYALSYEPADTLHDDALLQEQVPLFLANYEDQPKHRFGSGGENSIHRAQIWSRIIKGGIATVSAAGIALAIMSLDNPLSIFANAKASLAGAAPARPPQYIAAQPANIPTNISETLSAQDAAAPRQLQVAAAGAASPSRDEITAAYQSAIKSKVVAIEPVAREAPPAGRRIDADELAMLLKRAKGLLGIGDITAARLLLERAADAQEPEAALMLAGTYDPQVLGTQDMRSITPDPETARLWYQKAAQLGSADASRRLSQLQN